VKCQSLYCDMTGNFPHTPEPTPANLVELGELVANGDADLGFAVDILNLKTAWFGLERGRVKKIG